jgi:hypothetical protein
MAPEQEPARTPLKAAPLPSDGSGTPGRRNRWRNSGSMIFFAPAYVEAIDVTMPSE